MLDTFKKDKKYWQHKIQQSDDKKKTFQGFLDTGKNNNDTANMRTGLPGQLQKWNLVDYLN